MQHAAASRVPHSDDIDTDPVDMSSALYRAAIGPLAQARYLAAFRAFDQQGSARAGWHGAACLSALGWLVYRGLWWPAGAWASFALLGSLVVLGLAKLWFSATQAQLLVLAGLLVAAASLLWGLAADALYYRICNRRIQQAVAASSSMQQACARLAQASTAGGHWLAVGGVMGLPLLLVLAWWSASQPGTRPVRQRPATAPAGPPSAGTSMTNTVAASAPALIAVPPQPSPPEVLAAPQEPPAAPSASAGTAPMAAQNTSAPARGAAPGYAVQIGIFAEEANARKALHKLRAAGLAGYAEATGAQGLHQRVRVGPYSTEAAAERAAQRIRALDLPAAVVRPRGKALPPPHS